MSARQADFSASDYQYSYLNEDQIDSDLKCVVCGQPFVKPMVGKRCEHTFCQACINNWYQQNSSCPVCRMKTSFEPLTTRIVLSQLDRLHVHCSYCNENNIQRGNFNDHIQYRCRQLKVRCKAADLKCPWTGKREEQGEHSAVCPLLQIRPVIEELRAELSAQAHQLQMFMGEMREQLNYLQQHRTPTVENSARTREAPNQNEQEKERYDALKNDLRYCWTQHRHDRYESDYCDFCERHRRGHLTCLICSNLIAPMNIRIYNSYNGNASEVICKLCVQQYSK